MRRLSDGQDGKGLHRKAYIKIPEFREVGKTEKVAILHTIDVWGLMEFFGLEPLSNRCCLHCDKLLLDVDMGYYCKIHRDEQINGRRMKEVNNCTDWNANCALF